MLLNPLYILDKCACSKYKTIMCIKDLDEIWSTLRTLLGLALADFGRNLRSSDRFRGS